MPGQSAIANGLRNRLVFLLVSSYRVSTCSNYRFRLYASAATNERTIRYPETASPNPYQIFDIAHGSKIESAELKKRYYSLVKQYHPDTAKAPENASPAAKAAEKIMTERFNRIVDAYSILSSPVKKRSYDSTGYGWNYPDPIRDRMPSHARYNFTREEWERMKNFSNDRMWASGQYPDERGNPPDPPKPRPIDHEANMRTLMYIILFTCVVTYIQSLRTLSWAESFEEQVKRRYVSASDSSSSRVYTKYSGAPTGSMAYEEVALTRPLGHGGSGGADYVPYRDPIPTLRMLRARMREQAVRAGVDVQSDAFKEIDNQFVVAVGNLLQGRRVAPDAVPMARQLADKLVAECISKCKLTTDKE
ncbi:hypothetical protein V1512DRAFT_264908 [Lipomyces arxii]|uniref:uncharacterized protein n=1 Tax=Lipomyces arxii TaxID=56418 RepID=UPI0034CD342B